MSNNYPASEGQSPKLKFLNLFDSLGPSNSLTITDNMVIQKISWVCNFIPVFPSTNNVLEICLSKEQSGPYTLRKLEIQEVEENLTNGTVFQDVFSYIQFDDNSGTNEEKASEILTLILLY